MIIYFQHISFSYSDHTNWFPPLCPLHAMDIAPRRTAQCISENRQKSNRFSIIIALQIGTIALQLLKNRFKCYSSSCRMNNIFRLCFSHLIFPLFPPFSRFSMLQKCSLLKSNCKTIQFDSQKYAVYAYINYGSKICYLYKEIRIHLKIAQMILFTEICSAIRTDYELPSHSEIEKLHQNCSQRVLRNAISVCLTVCILFDPNQTNNNNRTSRTQRR